MTDVEEIAAPSGHRYSQIYKPRPDARFPNQNVAKMCWQNYVDFHRCVKKYGEDHPPCMYFKIASESTCPYATLERWDAAQERGFFPCRIMDK